MYIIFYLYVFMLLTLVTKGFTVKHTKYKKYSIGNDDLCSAVATREIDLKKDKEALIVTDLNAYNTRVDSAINFNCKFEVKSDSGLLVFINNMNFRKNESSGQCIDYVQIISSKHSASPKLCGYRTFLNDTDINPIDFNGKFETRIFISKTGWNEPRKRALEIVYTKFKRCNDDYLSCYQENDNKVCIHRQFFNDTIVNCPFVNCVDEGNCAILQQRILEIYNCGEIGCIHNYKFETDSTKIILSAVTSLIISFIVFVICIWICKKTGKVCWSANCISNQAQPTRIIEMQNRSGDSQISTAPENTTIPSAPDPSKDLPPSYESLFPST